MEPNPNLNDINRIASAIQTALQALPSRNTPSMRAVRQRYTREFKGASPELMLALANRLIEIDDLRWVGYELIQHHPGAFGRLGETELERLGRGIDSWWTVDSFARTLSGPAWLKGQVPDDLFLRWALSPDLWWRRAALVSTVAWNVRSHGGPGDVHRTLMICGLLVDDHEDMVVKAVSWALRELVAHDPGGVWGFLEEYNGVLASRVRREVAHKLDTGLKNPRRISKKSD